MMLEFASGSSNAVNSKKAVGESLDLARRGISAEPRLVIVHSTMGHGFEQLLTSVHELCPEAAIVGCTGSGVISREGVSERMRALALMVVTGEELAVAAVDGISGENSETVAAECARMLAAKLPDTNMIYVISPGLDVTGDYVVRGIESVFGPEVALLGAAAGDNGKVKRTPVFHGETVSEDALVLVGFADPSLRVIQGVHHGSLPIEDMGFTVTKAADNRIDELDGEPAWPALAKRLDFPLDTEPGSVIAITGMGMDLDEAERAAYDNDQILLAPFTVSEDQQSFHTLVSCPAGTQLRMMRRDEDHIFNGVDRLVGRMNEQLAGRRPLAVFQADCMARGRLALDRIHKDEIIARMQEPIAGPEGLPWLGVYGFGEYATLGGRNCFHHFTTSLSAIVRD